MNYSNYIDSGAYIDGNYRYRLWRIWDKKLPALVILMLNPSTADEKNDDPTITNCVKIAKNENKYGGIEIINLFAYRTSKKSELKDKDYPVGPLNDEVILKIINENDSILCAWGCYTKKIKDRVMNVIQFIDSSKHVYCIAKNHDNSPRHPSPRAVKSIDCVSLDDYRDCLKKGLNS